MRANFSLLKGHLGIGSHWYIFSLLFMAMSMLACSGVGNSKRNEVIDPFLSDIDRYTFKINQEPGNATLYFQRAQAYASERLFDRAITDMEQALSLDSIEITYWLYASELYYTTKRVGMARSAIEKALSINPTHLEANMRMGELQYYLGDYASAMQYLDQALVIDRFHAKAYFIKGMIFKENGDTALAISSFQTTIEQDPDYFHAYMMLGNIFADQHERIAVNYYNNAIRVNPEMTEAHYALGYFLQEHGNPKGAIKVYDDLLAIDPHHVPAMHNMAYTFLFYMNMPEDAIPWFTKALESDSTFFLAAYHRGYAHEMLGNKSNAVRDYTHALRMYPEMELAQKGLSRVKK